MEQAAREWCVPPAIQDSMVLGPKIGEDRLAQRTVPVTAVSTHPTGLSPVRVNTRVVLATHIGLFNAKCQ